MAANISYPKPKVELISEDELDSGDFFLFHGDLYLFTDTGDMVKIEDGYVHESHPSGACLRLVDVEIKVKYK